MNGIPELQALLKQRTWDKEVFLWLGPEKALLDTIGSANRVILDLLDIFDLDNLPADEDDTKDVLRRGLRQRLKAIPKGPDSRTVLIVKSSGLLARYQIGLKEFYDWFVGSHSLVALFLGSLPEKTSWPEEVQCDAKRLIDYFAESGMVKDVYAANA